MFVYNNNYNNFCGCMFILDSLREFAFNRIDRLMKACTYAIIIITKIREKV